MLPSCNVFIISHKIRKVNNPILQCEVFLSYCFIFLRSHKTNMGVKKRFVCMHNGKQTLKTDDF